MFLLLIFDGSGPGSSPAGDSCWTGDTGDEDTAVTIQHPGPDHTRPPPPPPTYTQLSQKIQFSTWAVFIIIILSIISGPSHKKVIEFPISLPHFLVHESSLSKKKTLIYLEKSVSPRIVCSVVKVSPVPKFVLFIFYLMRMLMYSKSSFVAALNPFYLVPFLALMNPLAQDTDR